MDRRWLSFRLPGTPLLATAETVIPAKGQAMQATFNGSAEHRVAQAIKEEAVSRAPRVNWLVVGEVFFALVALVAMIWSLWR